jgi:tetratricopeptide (TPR) repeat protein
MKRAAIAAIAITLGGATTADLRAQADVAALDRIEAAIEAGSTTGLREELERWLADGDGASPEDLGRAAFLRARLISDGDSARSEYLTIALDGRSSYGARAWLRLAQLELARGEPARAVEDLERFRSDYPRSPLTAASYYWSARALESGGELDEACSFFDRALDEANRIGDPLTGESASAGRQVCAGGGLTFTLQIGAFSGTSAAESLASTANALGFPARIVKDEDLQKVRVGRFASPDAARLLERRLRDEGFSVAIVAAES